MNLQELKKLVSSGESDRLEFKASTGQRTAAMKTVCGMPKSEYERRLVERLHATHRWENEPAAQGVSIKDLDPDEIHLTLTNAIDAGRMERPRKTDTRSILTGLGLIIDGRLNNAAVVLYGKSPRLEALYPQCLIQLARFRGTDRLSDFSDNRQYWGHAFSLLQRAEAFFKDHIPIAGKVYPDRFKREDRPLYHPRAFREALANAFCHRDYAVPGASVSVAVYDDRLEVINPGDLHFGITPKALTRPHESRHWNPIIAGVFYRAGIIEKWGTGTLNIMDWCRENGNPPPEWQVRAGAVVLIFKPLSDKTTRQPESQPESEPESTVRALGGKVIQLLSKGPLSKAEISYQLGQKQISGPLNKIIKAMVEEGVLTYIVPEKPNSRIQKYRLVEKSY